MPDDQTASPAPADPDMLCAEARRARELVESRTDVLRRARRRLADAHRRLESSLEDLDRTTLGERKVALASVWREAMEAEPDEVARREVTALWMRQVSELNLRVRKALRDLGTNRQDVAGLEASVSTADMGVAAARIRAESAEAACAEARGRRAVAEEQAVGAAGRSRVAAVVAASGTEEEITAVDTLEDKALPAITARPADSETVRRLVAGDRPTHEAIATELAEMSGLLPARYLLLLETLMDELAAAAVDAGELAFDRSHPLWSQLSPDDARLITRGLRDLGFRLDIHDGWFGGRAPSASDLAAALGFAGHDMRSIRAMPSGAELRDLPSSVQVATHDHLRRWAPDLTLDQMERALGARSARLGDLWDEWGRVRPLLADGLPALA